MKLEEIKKQMYMACALIISKGDMSVELWNDKAQCLLGPIANSLDKLLLLAEAVKSHNIHFAASTERGDAGRCILCEAMRGLE